MTRRPPLRQPMLATLLDPHGYLGGNFVTPYFQLGLPPSKGFRHPASNRENDALVLSLPPGGRSVVSPLRRLTLGGVGSGGGAHNRRGSQRLPYVGLLFSLFQATPNSCTAPSLVPLLPTPCILLSFTPLLFQTTLLLLHYSFAISSPSQLLPAHFLLTHTLITLAYLYLLHLKPSHLTPPSAKHF